MKYFLNILVSLSLLVSGLYSQAVFTADHSAYNGITLDTSDVPSPVEDYTEDYVQLSEVRMHYRVYGKDKPPMIMIHGNGGNAGSLAGSAAYFANDYTVYVTESRCHGETTETDELSYDLIAKDIVEFIKALNLEKPVIFGHSDGAIVAITIAASYPDVPGAIIACGANSSPSALKPGSLLSYTWRYMISGNTNKLMKMMIDGPDFTDEYLSNVTCPAYIVSAESDIVFPSDTKYMHENIKGSDMAIIIGGEHSSYVGDAQTYALARPWLDKVM